MKRVIFILSLLLAGLFLYVFYFHAMFYPSWYVKIGAFVVAHFFPVAVILHHHKTRS